MRIRTLSLFIPALLAVALSGCGDDDDTSSGTPPTSATPSATLARTFEPAPVTASPSRSLPPADHIALNVIDVLTFYRDHLQGGNLTPIECAGIDLTLGIIDCAEAGYGTIAVDPIPQVVSGDVLCRVLLDPQGVFFAASCAGQLASGPGAYIYAIQS